MLIVIVLRCVSPGRFFAVNEVKMFIAIMLLKYEIKLEDGKIPPPYWAAAFSQPDPNVHLQFRLRTDDPAKLIG